jgi:hypothetical protein
VTGFKPCTDGISYRFIVLGIADENIMVAVTGSKIIISTRHARIDTASIQPKNLYLLFLVVVGYYSF